MAWELEALGSLDDAATCDILEIWAAFFDRINTMLSPTHNGRDGVAVWLTRRSLHRFSRHPLRPQPYFTRPGSLASLPRGSIEDEYTFGVKQIDGSFNVQAYSLEVYGRGPAAPPPPPDFSRSYTSSYPSSSVAVGSGGGGGYDYRFNKGKDLATVSPPTARKSGKWLNDPEFQRKRRVASYKAYSVEGKVKVSIRRSFRWLKNKYTKVIYGWW